MSEIGSLRNGKSKWPKRLQLLSAAAGTLALLFYVGAQLYASAYQAYAAYAFEEQLQGREPSLKGFCAHFLRRSAPANEPVYPKKQVSGDELLRNMVYAPEIASRSNGWSAARLRAYERAAAPSSGDILGRLEIPSLNLSVMLLEGTGAWTLNRAVGHIEGTALPGQPGNLGVAGHRDGFFRCLKNIKGNATVTLTTLKGRYYYRVNSVRIVKPKDVKILTSTGKPTLTLVTCYPFYYVGNAPKRYVVTAEMIHSESPSDLAQDYARSH